MKVHIFIFRRDLRIEDNRGLNEAMKRGNVLPIFIFDPKQINPAENPYFSNKSVQFLIESLKDLESSIKKHKGALYYFAGEPSKVIDEILLKIS